MIRLARLPVVALALLTVLVLPSQGARAQRASVQRFDFQPDNGPVETGYTKSTHRSAYSDRAGFGFTSPPIESVDSTGHRWPIFGRQVTVDQAIPDAVLSDATRDSVSSGRRRPEQPFTFRVDVPPGSYDVTLWLGDVTRPLFQVRAAVNGAVVDVERLDVLITRGRLAVTTLNDGRTPSVGNAVPRTVRVDAPDGYVEVTVGPGDSTETIAWDYVLDQCPSFPDPEPRTEDMIPAFAGASLQALTLHPAVDPPIVAGDSLGTIRANGEDVDRSLQEAVDRFNSGDVEAAREAFEALPADLTVAKAAGLFWVAGHPATLETEREILAEAERLLVAWMADHPNDWAAADLLLQVRLADDAERYRGLYGYGGTPATENLGRANAIVEQFGPEHPYHLKGRILWLRNRGGLDPRRCTMSWERAQWLAQQMDPAWGDVNPYVHLYATDEWSSDGQPWTFIDWGELAGEGPEWARTLLSVLNNWLDLFEWWTIHRQQPTGEIGGGWTDDVEIIPAFGLAAYVLEDASHLSSHAAIKFTDGIWDSRIIDSRRGYQAQYADVEHTAEPTGNSLHMYPMLRYGDPEGMERIMKSGKTFTDLFLTTTPRGHTHFKGNHMSATQIATNPNHRADIPLNGRVTAPFPFLVWYSSNPGMEAPLRDWARAWVEDAARTDKGKPAGIFPQLVWVPDDEIGYPGTEDWYSADTTYGQWGEFPKYQYFLYNMAALFYLRTGDEAFLEPFDTLQTCALAWGAEGRPAGPAPEPGKECAWAGGKLINVAGNTMFEVARATGRSDWDDYLSRFAQGYGRFYLEPSEETLLADQMDEIAATMKESWPYRTTEGVMTDRILLPGWFNVIAYYLGANVPSFFYGLPVQAATWSGTGRLFAAAVTEATTTDLAVTTYRFADDDREVRLKPWGLEPGGEYVLEAGPAPDLGAPPSSVDQTVPFRLDRRDEGVTFTLPGRTVYAIRVRQTAPGTPTTALAPDPGLAARDVTYDADEGAVGIRVHNIGAADASDVRVALHEGSAAEGPLIETATIASIEAPNDLVPRWQDVRIAYEPTKLPAEVTVVVTLGGDVIEVTEANNVVTAVIGGAAPDYPPPMLLSVDPIRVAPGGTVDVVGRNFRQGVEALSSESPSEHLSVRFVDEEHLVVSVSPDAPEGVTPLSVRNPDGLQSNLLPLTVDAEARPVPTPAGYHVFVPAAFRR